VTASSQLDSATADVATNGLPEPHAATPVEQAVTALEVTSQPAGARVTVDGIGWGQTPVAIRYLSPGLKRIRVTRDGHAAAERVVRVDEDRSNRVFIRLRTATSPRRAIR
jgi:hypothetical protein